MPRKINSEEIDTKIVGEGYADKICTKVLPTIFNFNKRKKRASNAFCIFKFQYQGK